LIEEEEKLEERGCLESCLMNNEFMISPWRLYIAVENK